MLSFPLTLTNSLASSYPLTNQTQEQRWCSPTIAFFPFPNTCHLPQICSPLVRKTNAKAHNILQGSSGSSEEQEQEEKYEVLSAVRSKYNDIVIVDTPKARMLLLDSTRMFQFS